MFYINPESLALLKFDPDKAIEFNHDFYDIVTSYFHLQLYQLEPAGSHVITYDAYRPDLICYRIYKSVQYKMLLMEYNKIFEIKKLKSGLTLRYPSLSAMENVYLTLKSLDRKVNS